MSSRLTDEEYEKIQTAHPGLRLMRIPTAAGEIVIRQPSAQEESAFQTVLFGPGTNSSVIAWRNLLIATTVHPDRQTLAAWLASWTGLAMNNRVIKTMKLIRGEADEEEAK